LMRTRVTEIRETGRNAQGVRLIKLDDGDKLVAMAKVEADEADATPAAPATSPDDPPTPDASDGDGSLPT